MLPTKQKSIKIFTTCQCIYTMFEFVINFLGFQVVQQLWA